MGLHDLSQEKTYPILTDEEKRVIVNFTYFYNSRYKIGVHKNGNLSYKNTRRDQENYNYWSSFSKGAYSQWLDNHSNIEGRYNDIPFTWDLVEILDGPA